MELYEPVQRRKDEEQSSPLSEPTSNGERFLKKILYIERSDSNVSYFGLIMGLILGPNRPLESFYANM